MTLTRREGEPGDDHWLAIVSVDSLLDAARDRLAVGDASGAMAVLADAQSVLRRHLNPDGVRTAEMDEGIPCTRSASASQAVSLLTTAELRLAPYLATHLTFREIGERLYGSGHTIKTQAISIYRKLGVSSRSEAISAMQELGVLRPDSPDTA